MKTKNTFLLVGLSLALVTTLLWMPGFITSKPAHANILFTPTPVTEKPPALPNPEGIPNKPDQLKAIDAPAKLLSPGSPDDILNGDFENGPDGSWEESSSQGYELIVHRDYLPTTPHSGDWAAWLGGVHEEIAYILQSVAVPSDISRLRYWYWIGSEDICGYDFAWLKINDTDLQTYDLCESTNSGGWIQQTVDISAYAGTTISLQFRVETDVSLISNFLVDDIILLSEDQSIYLPLVLKNFWVGYFDDFSDPNSGWASGEDATKIYRYLNSEYQIYFKQPDSGFALTPDLVLPSDYSIEVDARKVSAGTCSYGLVFGSRFTSTSWETYQVLIWPTAGEFYVNKRLLDGTWIQIQDWTYSPAINLDYATNHIKAERIGTQIRIYVNGTLVFYVTDTSFTGAGRDAGIRAYSYADAPVDVRFDNFRASIP